ncbi:uncharacterized protein LOC135083865 [Ostrinia nubilalis]|uniref:uncharacterized protein LOC135083865 n=1 Tax=Ostrinia nubilalis TaxID=29057 RepID=UPI0030825D70
MRAEACKVCGSTETNLIDGYYYCVECGTQDANVRETVVEEMELADGTISHKQKRKIYKVADNDDNLSEEWHKWHAYNFILVGLADEIIALGAKPSFKKKLIWLWTQYIKKFQDKRQLGLNAENDENQDTTNNNFDDSDSDEEEGFYNQEFLKKKPKKYKKHLKMNTKIDLSVVKRGLFFSLIYVALNLNCDNIHMSDLMRFVREGRFDIYNCEKYVPKEIKIKEIHQWAKFYRSKVNSKDQEVYAMTLFKFFKIRPLVPDLKLLVHRYAKELCLPDDFKNLVFSLMNNVTCDYLKLDLEVMKRVGRIPFYECIVMAYFLVAFKMMFGLDDDYEIRLSDAVDKANEENCYLKSYKLGGYSSTTDRLFSFREWCSFIQLRKIVLCKNYLHMAEHFQLPIDHYVYMEQCTERKTLRKPTVGDEITMNLLEKIPLTSQVEVIPLKEFKPSMTPLASASDTIRQYFDDPDLKLMFCEDFTQYSLKYATEKLYLKESEDNPENVVVGVSETNKIINNYIIGYLDTGKIDVQLVYVRNCDNKNWLKTNQPSVDHIVKVEPKTEKDIDHGYDSNADNNVVVSSNEATNNTEAANDDKSDASRNVSHVEDASVVEITNRDNTNATNTEEPLSDIENASTVDICSKDDTSSSDITETPTEDKVLEIKKDLETIQEEEYGTNIFDDDFADLIKEEIKEEPPPEPEQVDTEQNFDDHQELPATDNHDDTQSDVSLNDLDRFFNPATFDREKTIRELILATCKKYRISIPDEYSTKEPKKRKSKLIEDGAGESSAKKRKLNDGAPKRKITKPGIVQKEVNNLLVSYYENLKHDVLFQISEHVKSVVNNISRTQDVDDSQNQEEATHLDSSAREDNDSNPITDPPDLNADDNHHSEDLQENIEIDSSNVEPIENDEVDRQPKGDPRFDEKEYDPKQLYVRIEDEGSDAEDVYDVADDPEIAEILDRKIEEIVKGEKVPAASQPKKPADYDSEEDLPLSVLKEQRESILRKKHQKDNLPPLVTKLPEKEYFYWNRQYDSLKMRKEKESCEPFGVELNDNYSKSFGFVLRECADVIGYTPFRLYKELISLERRLLCVGNLNH